VTAAVDVLVPTYRRAAALAVTLSGIAAQTARDLRIVVSDQSEDAQALRSPLVAAMVRVLEAHGRLVELHHHVPRRGLAEQRAFLLAQATADCVLFLDDDVWLEPWLIDTLLAVLRSERCGFVGSALHGLGFRADVRPHQQAIAPWDGPVVPEDVRPDSAAWQRHHLHSAANLWHVQQRLGATPARPLRYRVAWVGGCVCYDRTKLVAVGGFDFWSTLPVDHAGEDVLAQLRVMRRFGGCAILPSGAYHLELPTTVPHRPVDAPRVLR
jgi:glycosyltransferase involved in cell wall biosynthesis